MPPKRLLILVPGDVGERMSGPSIRAWLLAQALASHHPVTAAIEGRLPDGDTGKVRVVPASRHRMLAEMCRADAVIAACLPPYVLAAARATGTVTVADHYDPVELELGTIPGSDRRIRAARAIRRLQHRHADALLCAGEAQRSLLERELAAVGRVNGSGPPIGIVPFGLPDPPARSAATPLRDRFGAIAETDKIVLWWGKIWSWFDAETAIRAFAPLAASRPEIKLVLTTGPAPDPTTESYSRDSGARRLAEQLQLLGRTVFFLDEWIPYQDRHHCLHEADLGLTLHGDTPEAEFAARARYMDYLWTTLPCVLARGDEVAARFGATGFAELVAPGDEDAVRAAVIALLDDRARLTRAAAAGAALADRYRWTALADDLSELLDRTTATRRGAAGRLLAGSGAYYALRARDKLAARA